MHKQNLNRYDILIRVRLNSSNAPTNPRPVVKYRDEKGHIRRVFSGKPCASFEQATLQSLKAFYEDINKRFERMA
jgi:hypothetical protein